jgi:hypothetical protein
MAGDGGLRPVFELCDAAPTGPEQEVLGLWTPTMLPATDAVQFDASAGAIEAAPVWRASYPADPALVEADLARAREQLEAAESALAAAPARLDALLAQGGGGLAYAAPSPDGLSGQPEEDLILLVGEIQGRAPAVSYGPGDQPGERWAEAFDAFEVFTSRVQQLVAHYAWVETRVEDRLVGQTAVTWTGDVDTILVDRLEPGQIQLHQQTLELALASRRTMFRTSTLVIASAVKVSVLLATPGGIALAFPVVLRFINQLRKELHPEAGKQKKEA